MKNNIIENKKGITLIALVVTIIVLIILAGISINLILGENGIITKAKEAKNLQTEAQEKEGIQLAIVTAQIGNNGYKDLEQTSLEKAIKNQFKNQEVQVIDNGDETFTITFSQTNNVYDITYAGKVEKGVNWEYAKANAKAPESQDEERNNGVIGLGTNGESVDMDLWEYYYEEENQGYGLNDATSLSGVGSAKASRGYLGTDFSNIIIPQYISTDNGETWKPVVDLTWTFFNCTELEKIEKIPNTVTTMLCTFRRCTNFEYSDISLSPKLKNMFGAFYDCEKLQTTPRLPDSVENGTSLFYGCYNLTKVTNLPNKLNTMYAMFIGCSALTEITEIPNNVQSMEYTFYNCTSLEKAPKIPESVTNLIGTFRGCTNLKGTIEINASVNGNEIMSEQKNEVMLDYWRVFYEAVTENSIQLTGTCTVLEEIVEASGNENITLK